MEPTKYKLLRDRLKVASKTGNKAHVMPNDGRWIVFKEGNDLVLGDFSKRTIALKKAKEYMQSGDADKIVLHSSNGKVEKILLAV